MHLKNKPPVFVPSEFQAELEQMSKAALMDLVWDFAITTADGDTIDAIMSAVRMRRDVVLNYRK